MVPTELKGRTEGGLFGDEVMHTDENFTHRRSLVWRH